LKLWAGETISLFGTQVTVLALPLVAVLTLGASAGEVGMLNAARFAPFIGVTLLAGVIVDRARRRPILIRTNVGRTVLLAVIPVAAAFDALRIEYLYVIGFLVGVLTVFFDLAYQSYVPSLVNRTELTGANSKLQASASAAEVGGPGLGGVLVQVVTAPFAIVLDAVSFLVSALLIGRIRAAEPAPETTEQPRTVAAIRAGFAFTFKNPYLRPIAGEAATFNLFEQALMTVFVVYAIRSLGFSPAILGLVLSTGAVGALIGSLAAASASRRLGLGPTILAVMVVACTVPIAIPFVDGALFLALVFFVWNLAVAVSNVLVVSLRQAITPDRMLGRMNASYRFFTYGAIPLGALLGGTLAEATDLRTALLVSALGLLLALSWIVASPLRKLRKLPETA
jgi:MFS family permease